MLTLLKYKLKPRHKWFSSTDADADEGWFGPYANLEDAFIDCMSNEFEGPVYIGQGHRLTKAEIEEYGVDYAWEVDTRNLLKIQEVISEELTA